MTEIELPQNENIHFNNYFHCFICKDCHQIPIMILKNLDEAELSCDCLNGETLFFNNIMEKYIDDEENFSRHFYSFDFGNAHFVVLDSQWDEIKNFKSGLIDEQKIWLEKDLNSTDKTWKIIFIHKDVLQYRINGRPERLEGFSDVGEIFMPEFERLGADVVFTAHLHTYRNRGRLKNFQADETGPLYILTGLSGDVRYPGLWIDHKLDKVTAPQPETDNFLTLEVDEKILSEI